MGVPLAFGVLKAENLGGPAHSPNLPLRENHLRIVGGLVENLPQNAMPDAGIRVLVKKPISEPTRKRHETEERQPAI